MRRMIGKFASAVRSRLVRQSFSPDGLDVKMLPYINFRRGFFVEAGANNGISQSNTLFFEKYLGWRGLLVEAIPALAEKCRHNRPKSVVENCALVGFDHPGTTVEMCFCNLMSFVKGAFGCEEADERHLAQGRAFLKGGQQPHTLVVPARPLAQILAARGIDRIDFMSLDVEGAEVDVLRGIDFSAVTPAHLLVEVRHAKRETIEQILKPHYDVAEVFTSNAEYADILYRAKRNAPRSPAR